MTRLLRRLALAGLVVLESCSATKEPTTQANSSTESTVEVSSHAKVLAGFAAHTWYLIEVDGTPWVDRPLVTLTVTIVGSLGTNNNCNGMGTNAVTFEGDSLVIGTDAATTLVLCPEEDSGPLLFDGYHLRLVAPDRVEAMRPPLPGRLAYGPNEPAGARIGPLHPEPPVFPPALTIGPLAVLPKLVAVPEEPLLLSSQEPSGQVIARLTDTGDLLELDQRTGALRLRNLSTGATRSFDLPSGPWTVLDAAMPFSPDVLEVAEQDPEDARVYRRYSYLLSETPVHKIPPANEAERSQLADCASPCDLLQLLVSRSVLETHRSGDAGNDCRPPTNGPDWGLWLARFQDYHSRWTFAVDCTNGEVQMVDQQRGHRLQC